MRKAVLTFKTGYIKLILPISSLNHVLGSGYKGKDWGMANVVDPGQECGLILTRFWHFDNFLGFFDQPQILI